MKKPHGKASKTEEIRSLRDDILSVRTMIGIFDIGILIHIIKDINLSSVVGR